MPEGAELIRHLYSPAPGQTLLVFGVVLPFPLYPSDGGPAPALDGVWDRVTQVLGKEGLLDEGWPKPSGELLAAGACHPPAGHHDQPVSVSISAGALTKRLAVFGERRYGPMGRISSPLPFESMPLTPAQAFGGEDHPENPMGKGLDTRDGAELPNIESPNTLIVAHGDQPDPAGFGPLPIIARSRARHLGDHGAQWLRDRWPHLPMDTDPQFFLTAREDQRIQGFWMGGETVLARNMHPDFPDLVGQVPLLRPRFFVHQTQPDGDARLLELKVNADTIWLLPGERMGLTIYRALIPVHAPDARDVNGFLADFETPDEPERPIEYYVNRCLRAMSPELFKDIPDPVEIEKANAKLSNQELLQKVSEQKALFKEMLANQGIDEAGLMQQLSANPHTRKFAQTIAERSGSLSGFFNEIESLLHTIEGQGAPPAAASSPSLNEVLPAPAATAPHAPDAPIVPAETHGQALRDDALAARNRQIVLHRSGNGQTCANLDLSQANLAGLNLAGMDFSGALLAGANLAGAQLQGANLQDANLQGARLDAANLSGCQLMRATLDQTSFSGAVLQGAVLDDSDCTGANFAGTDLSGISLRNTTLSYAWLNRVRAPQIQAEGADFSHANLEGIDLTRANLDRVNFTGARMRGAVLDDASCVSANLTQTDLSDASLARCILRNSQSTPGSQWRGAKLHNAVLDDASWIGASLEGAQMDGIKALNADLSDTDLRSARITDADLRKATFDRSNLSHARLGRSNLMEASLIHSDLTHCWLDDCNLYAATFMDTILDHARLTGANLDATILKVRADA